jgi:hypothetical protein
LAVVGLTYLAFVWLTNGTVTTTLRPHVPVPMVGFSFSPEVAKSLGQEPGVALARLLQAFQPDMVPEWMRSGEQAFAVLRGHGQAGS